MNIGRVSSWACAMLVVALAGCSESDPGSGEEVDTSGACGVICEGGELSCAIGGFDPADGLEACTRECQAEWPSEQDPECVGDATFVLTCVEANQSCETLDNATCGVAETDLVECASAPSGAGGSGGDGGGGAGGNAGPVIDIDIQAFSLAVRESCDGSGEGDFFINLRLQEERGDELILIDDSQDNLVQSGGGITNLEDREFVASGSVPAVTGTRVLVRTSMLENDPDGPQVSQGVARTYEYDAETPCWRLEGDEECRGPEGEIDVLIVRLVDNAGPACDAELRSRFSAGPPR